MNKERAENDYGSHTALAPSKEKYYSTIRQGKDFLNITALEFGYMIRSQSETFPKQSFSSKGRLKFNNFYCLFTAVSFFFKS